MKQFAVAFLLVGCGQPRVAPRLIADVRDVPIDSAPVAPPPRPEPSTPNNPFDEDEPENAAPDTTPFTRTANVRLSRLNISYEDSGAKRETWRFESCDDSSKFYAAVDDQLEPRLQYPGCFEVTYSGTGDGDDARVDSIAAQPRPKKSIPKGYVFTSLVEAALYRAQAKGHRIRTSLTTGGAEGGMYNEVAQYGLMGCGFGDWSAVVRFPKPSQAKEFRKLEDGACHEVTWTMESYGYYAWEGPLEKVGPAQSSPATTGAPGTVFKLLEAKEKKAPAWITVHQSKGVFLVSMFQRLTIARSSTSIANLQNGPVDLLVDNVRIKPLANHQADLLVDVLDVRAPTGRWP